MWRLHDFERPAEVNIPITAHLWRRKLSHKGGIHSHGVIENSKTFEPGIMTPEMVGHKRRIIVGKHTGRHAVAKVLEVAGYQLTDEQFRISGEDKRAW